MVGAAPRVVIISASVGSGHDGAATELSRRLCASGATVTRHDFVDLMPGRTGVLLRSFYRRQLEFAPRSWGWLLAAGKHRSLSAPTRLADVETLRVVGSRADVVVSTYPLASQVLGRLRRTGRLTIPTVTYLTDMSVHPQWIADGVDTHLAIHDEPAAQARKLGARDVHVVTPVVDPAFTRAAPPSSRGRWGLPEKVPLALIVAGAWGVGEVEQTARDVAATRLAVPVVACGQNERLRHRLVGSGTTALGWIDDMPALLRNCQVVVQNAGGLSSLEALHAGVPVITYRSLPGHGRDNAEALDRAGWVPWLRTPAELADGLRAALTPHRDRPDLTGRSPESIIITHLPVPA